MLNTCRQGPVKQKGHPSNLEGGGVKVTGWRRWRSHKQWFVLIETGFLSFLNATQKWFKSAPLGLKVMVACCFINQAVMWLAEIESWRRFILPTPLAALKLPLLTLENVLFQSEDSLFVLKAGWNNEGMWQRAPRLFCFLLALWLNSLFSCSFLSSHPVFCPSSSLFYCLSVSNSLSAACMVP